MSEFRRRQMMAAASGKRQIVWNQLIYNGNFAEGGNDPTGWNKGFGITFDNSDADVVVLSGNNYVYQMPYQSQFTLDSSHIYYYCAIAKQTLGTGGYFYFTPLTNNITLLNSDFSWTNIRLVGYASRNNGTSSSYGLVRIMNRNSGVTINKNSGVQLFDLTLMFGAGNEPTKEQFDAMFGTPYTYHPFNLGEVIYI